MNAAKNTLTLNNGVEMPLLGLGTYLLRGAECERCVAEAAELGYRLFDSAQMYGNEREVGRALPAAECRVKSCSSLRRYIRPTRRSSAQNRR